MKLISVWIENQRKASGNLHEGSLVNATNWLFCGLQSNRNKSETLYIAKSQSTATLLSFLLFARLTLAQPDGLICIPYLEQKPIIDGDLSDWKMNAFTDGEWSLERIRSSPWFDEKRNNLTIHDGESESSVDLVSSYYMAWDSNFIYVGAEVHDNVNDVFDSKHEPKRWYYKDAVAWFIESPADSVGEQFGEGDHAFCFIADTTMPDYVAWWRHGNSEKNYIEESLPLDAYQYTLTVNPWGKGNGDYILEAKVEFTKTLAVGSRSWNKPTEGDVYRIMIVHCDPDGGDYGGHFLIYGKGDNDLSWSLVILTSPIP